MCWSTEVSWAFACFDASCVAILLVQHYWLTAEDRRAPATPLYAVFMSLIAIQEFAQFMIWRRGHTLEEDPEHCQSSWDVFWALVAFASAALVPFLFVLDMPPSLLMERRCASTIWLAAVCTDLICVWLSGQMCVHEGPHHHQVWICASAVTEVGGFPLYVISLLGYMIPCVWGIRYAQSIPPHEKLWLVNIFVANGVVAHGIYGWTLEGCSIWCWSAFCGGVYLCTKDFLLPRPNKAQDGDIRDGGELNDHETVPILEAVDS